MATQGERRFVVAAGVALLALAISYAVPSFYDGPVAMWAYAVLTVGAIGTAAALAAIRSRRSVGPDRVAWALVSAGMAAWGIGELGWEILYVGQGAETVSPHWTDLFYLLNIPLTALGLLAFSWRRGALRASIVRLLDGLVVAGALIVASWPLFLRDLAASTDGSGLAIAITLAYPIGDLLLLSVLALAVVRLEPARRRALAPLAAGLAITAVADAGFAVITLRTGGYGTTWLDLGWTAGALAIGWAALRPAPATLARVGPPARLEQWLPHAAMAPAFLVLVVDFVRHGDIDYVSEAVGLSTAAAVLLRQALFTDLHMRLSTSLLAAQHLAGLGTWRFDVRSGRFLLDDEAGRLASARDEDLTLTSLLKRLDPADRQPLVDAWTALEHHGRPFELTLRVVDPAGASVRHLQMRAADGHAPHGTFLDVTQQAQLAEERRRADAERTEARRLAEINQFKTQFINMAAHELNTPLTPIRLSLATLRHKGANGATQPPSGDVLGLLERNVDRLTRLLRDVLDSARLQADRLRLRRLPMDLAALARDAAEEHQPAAAARGLTLEVHADGPCPVEGDQVRLHEVAMNLLGNALKFTPPGGRIRVDVERDGPVCRLRVQDDGRGIAPSDLPKLFQPFSQVGPPGEGPAAGTGLGLYIVKGIVEQHGGHVTAASPGVGLGTCFTVELPALDELVAQVAAAVPHASAGLAE